MRYAKLIAAIALTSTVSSYASAEDKSDSFYQGKTIQLFIGYSAGGGYDVYARLVARYMGAHIPGNPDIIPVNMPGAGSLRLANWLYNAAPRDGTAIGAVARGVAFDPLLNPGDSEYEASKFNWLGSVNNEVSVCVAWHTSGVSSIDDLTKTEITVGGTGGAADTDQFPKIMNGVVGTKMRVITGYPGGNDIGLAMERGEVAGRCGWSWSSVVSTRPDWLQDKKINVLVQLALKRHQDLPDIPLIMDFAKTTDQKQLLRLVFARQTMGRPIVAPPAVPEERVALLRKAFMATVKDPGFLAEAKKAKLEIDPVSGEEVQDLVNEAYATPKAVVNRITEMLN